MDPLADRPKEEERGGGKEQSPYYVYADLKQDYIPVGREAGVGYSQPVEQHE